MKGFQDYCIRLRPILDDAIGQTLQGLFKDLHARPDEALKDSFRGGKMIRGSLVCLVNESLGGNLQPAVPRSVAVELIHGATLIHDDFVDQDRARRGRPAAWTLAGARKAVLLGDVIFASAIEMMSDLSRDDGLAASRAIARISKGAFQEPIDPSELARHLGSDAVPESFYDAIIDLKTGVLFGVACELGAIAAGAERDVRDAFYRYGLLIGEAYQIADDLQEVRHHLSSGVIDAREIAALAPALARFGKDLQPSITPMLKRERSVLPRALLTGFEEVRVAMEQEMARRLELAHLEVAGLVPDSRQGAMIHAAPRDLIEMFNGT
ncbi:polyprenyl synthetase family protein [Methylocaldum sp.]|uniref:polyprenyl synthetase family protein n=1 Tax=Methylocaldum sp. TaxID=1969727 RepID=UPI002D5FF700|nr:polyprenyl synthetase family protein [Methylocaldum sp.]HYE34117.1 polyprenyl synthetase family protein [Methylocaldum sp.]